MTRYNLHNQIQPFHRCIVCNGLLQAVAKEAIVDQLEPKTVRYYQDFFQCADCQKIYWRGSHFDRMTTFIDRFVTAPERAEGQKTGGQKTEDRERKDEG
jgi:uncharacterized protein with PIN domain